MYLCRALHATYTYSQANSKHAAECQETVHAIYTYTSLGCALPSIIFTPVIIAYSCFPAYSRLHCDAHTHACTALQRTYCPALAHTCLLTYIGTRIQRCYCISRACARPNTFFRMKMGFCRAGISDPLCRGEMEEAIDRACGYC